MHNEREIEAKLQLLTRALMSYIDFQQAAAIASIILSENLHDNYPRENRIKLEALNAAMVVAYCRPFSGNKGIPDLPNRFTRGLTAEEKEMHDALMVDRNQVIAHSDSEAWNMRPHCLNVNGNQILDPLHNGVHRPFLREPTERISLLAGKQRERCFEIRERLEKELKQHIPISSIEHNSVL